MSELINIIGPDGVGGTIPSDQLQGALDKGYRVETPEETRERWLQREYGDSPITAGIEGAARGASFGLSDVLLTGLGADQEAMRERRERNTLASGIGEAAGFIAPALLTGGGGLAAGAAKAAGGLAERALVTQGGGLLARAATRAGTAAARTGAEGALFGLGQGISDVTLAQDPMSAEAIVGELGHEILLGAGLGAAGGAGLSLAGSTLGAAAGQASKVVKRATTKLQQELGSGTEGMLSTTDDALRAEVMGMTRPQLDAALQAETSALRAQRLAEGKILARDLESFYHEQRNALFKLRQQLPDKALKKDAIRATEGFKKILGDLESLAEEPVTALKPLRRLEQQLGAMQRYLPEDAMQPSMDSVATLKDRVVDLTGDVASPRLEAFRERLAMLDRPPPKTPLLDGMTQGMGATAGGAIGAATGIPYAGMAGAWLGKEFADVLKPLMRRVLGSFTEHAGAIDDGAAKFMAKLGPPEAAGKALERLAGAAAVSGGSAYERATAAVRAAAANLDETDGVLAQELSGLEQAAPQTATQVRQSLLAKVQFLAAKVPPVATGFLGAPMEPSDSERATFARYVAAAEDPLRVLREIRAGMVMPETVEAAAALYPRHLERIKASIMAQLADPVVRARVPYATRMQLGTVLGIPVDPTLDPSFIALMQTPRVEDFRAPGGPPRTAPADITSAQRLTTGGLR
jgi:hypothetical protein